MTVMYKNLTSVLLKHHVGPTTHQSGVNIVTSGLKCSPMLQIQKVVLTML